MTTILMITLMVANYMALHRLYDAVSGFCRRRKKQAFLRSIQDAGYTDGEEGACVC